MTNVVGAVAAPIDVAGLDTAVPPEMLDVLPAPEVPSSNQVVVKVNTVLPALIAAVVLMYSGVYGDVVLFNWKIVVAAAPGVKLYQPVVVVSVVCVPPVPPIRVVPVYVVPEISWEFELTRPLK